MELFRKAGLFVGAHCLIIRPGTYGNFQGRLVTLVKNHPKFEQKHNNVACHDFWETDPPLKGPAGPNGEIRRLKFSAHILMPLSGYELAKELLLERREECKSDPRMAAYILGKDAAYSWKHLNPPKN